MSQLNSDFQQENRLRVERIREHKRMQVLQSQQALREKNQRKSNSFRTFDCNFRKQTVLNQMAREETLKAFNKMVKIYPYQQDQRQKMATTLQELNMKLDLGLRLEFPRSVRSGMARNASESRLESANN